MNENEPIVLDTATGTINDDTFFDVNPPIDILQYSKISFEFSLTDMDPVDNIYMEIQLLNSVDNPVVVIKYVKSEDQTLDDRFIIQFLNSPVSYFIDALITQDSRHFVEVHYIKNGGPDISNISQFIIDSTQLDVQSESTVSLQNLGTDFNITKLNLVSSPFQLLSFSIGQSDSTLSVIPNTSATPTCATALFQHAEACTNLTVKNYQYIWTQFQSLCQSMGLQTPSGYTTTYTAMATTPTLGATVASLSPVYAQYNQACNAVFAQAVTTLDTMRIGSYIDLYNKYVAFRADSNVQTIDAGLAETPSGFPTVAEAIEDQASLKSGNQYLPYTDANVGTVDGLRLKYGEDLHLFSPEASVLTDGAFLQKLLKHIRKELAEFVEAFDTMRSGTEVTYRPSEAGKEDIGIPPENTSTNAQDLIEVMDYYMPQSGALLIGGAQQTAVGSIEEYKRLYDAYNPDYLIANDIAITGAGNRSHATLRSEADGISFTNLSLEDASAKRSMYSTAKTNLEGVILTRLKALCREAMEVYVGLYNSFKTLLSLTLPTALSTALSTAQAPDTYLNSKTTADFDTLKTTLASYKYPTSPTVPVESAMRTLVEEIKRTLLTRIQAVETTRTTNADLLAMPLRGLITLSSEIANLATIIQTDLSGATATDVGDAGLLGIATKYFGTNGLKVQLDQELARLRLLKAARETAATYLAFFYDVCYLPFQYLLPTEYPLHDVATYFSDTVTEPFEAQGPSCTGAVARSMSDAFNEKPADALQTLSTAFFNTTPTSPGHIQTLVAKIKELVTDDLTQYKTLYNRYNSFASTYSSLFTEQTGTSNILNTIDLTGANWPSTNNLFINQNVTDKPVDTCANIKASLESIRTLHRLHMERGTDDSSSFFFQLAKSIEEEFRLFLLEFQKVSTEVSNNSYIFQTVSDVSVSFEYNLYDQDSDRLNLPTQESATVLQDAYKLFMNTETNKVQSYVNLPIGMIPRYEVLIPLFCIADDRRRALANMQQYWQKYRTLVDNLIAIPSDTLSGVQEIRGYFTGGQLNAAFNGKGQTFYEDITKRFSNPDTIVDSQTISGNHFVNAKEFTKNRVRPLVQRFMDGLLETYNTFRETDASLADISDIFYVDPTALTEDEVCEGIYADPPRYPRLLKAAEYLNLKASMEKYKECIPNDIRWRRSENLLGSRLA